MTAADGISLDAPIFDPAAFRLSDEQAAIIATARDLGQAVFAGRAAAYDREAKFPIENYRDLHRAGLLGIAIPKKHGGLGADYQTYALAAAEIGRYCGATALTWNMHVCSTLWSGPLADDLDMDAATRAEHERRRAVHYKRIVDDGAIYSQPFSEGGAAAAGGVAFGTEAKPVKGGWLVNGKKIFASLSGHADYYGVLCTEIAEGEKASRRNTLYLALPAKADGVSVVGDWDPLGMRGTVSRTLLFKDVFVAEDAALMPRGVYFQAAMRWPHMFLTLSPTYMGLAQAAYDFTVRYLRGEVPGTPPVKRRMYPTKQIAVAQMQIKLEQIKAIWFQAVTEARANPDQGAGAARLRRAIFRHGRRQRDRDAGDPHLRRPGDAEIAAAGADLSRQPLRLADAALDRRTLPRPHRPRSAVRDRRDGRLVRSQWTFPISSSAMRPSRRTSLRSFSKARRSATRALHARIEQAARALKAEFGIGRGDRVAILSLNRPDYLVLLYACARLGAMLVPLNWRLAVAEQLFILSDASVKVLVLEQAFAAILPDAGKEPARHKRRRARFYASAGQRIRRAAGAGARRRPQSAYRSHLPAADRLHLRHHRPAEGRGAAAGGAAVERRDEPAHARPHLGRSCADRAAVLPCRRPQHPDHAGAASRRHRDHPCALHAGRRRSPPSRATARP